MTMDVQSSAFTPGFPSQTASIPTLTNGKPVLAQDRQVGAVEFPAPTEPSSPTPPAGPATAVNPLPGVARKEMRLLHLASLCLKYQTLQAFSSLRLHHEGRDRFPGQNLGRLRQPLRLGRRRFRLQPPELLCVRSGGLPTSKNLSSHTPQRAVSQGVVQLLRAVGHHLHQLVNPGPEFAEFALRPRWQTRPSPTAPPLSRCVFHQRPPGHYSTDALTTYTQTQIASRRPLSELLTDLQTVTTNGAHVAPPPRPAVSHSLVIWTAFWLPVCAPRSPSLPESCSGDPAG